jgi:uncharacterized membrane-anchored protein
MKTERTFLWIIVFVALLMTGIAGALDIAEKKTITKEHLWNDGLFIMLFAIFIVLVIQ